MRKYAVDGLADGRGRAKPEREMDEVEKLRAQNKILQAQIKGKEMEIALLKKLNEPEVWDARAECVKKICTVHINIKNMGIR